MGGSIEWQALPLLVELYGVTNIEYLIEDLLTIRDETQRQVQH